MDLHWLHLIGLLETDVNTMCKGLRIGRKILTLRANSRSPSAPPFFPCSLSALLHPNTDEDDEERDRYDEMDEDVDLAWLLSCDLSGSLDTMNPSHAHWDPGCSCSLFILWTFLLERPDWVKWIPWGLNLSSNRKTSVSSSLNKKMLLQLSESCDGWEETNSVDCMTVGREIEKRGKYP